MMNNLTITKKKEIFELGQLFEEVQLSGIFPDNKTFVDCLPKRSLEAINDNYLEVSNFSNFDLKTFVFDNFEVPKIVPTDYKSDTTKSAQQHLEALWEVLTRHSQPQESSLIPLPFPYVVPGGRFREVYYWDSYFTMLGLQISGKIDMIQYIIDNFSFLINQIGYIPNANRTYFLGRSQPPFFSLMVNILSEEKGKQILQKYLPELEKEYRFWMKDAPSLSEHNQSSRRVVRLIDGSIMNRYWDENDFPRPEAFKEDTELGHEFETKDIYRHLRAAAESGWDFSSRWFKEVDSFASIHTTDIIPVDLNCLLLHLEEKLAEAHQLSNNAEAALNYNLLAQQRRQAIQKYCWNDAKSFYFDYDFKADQFKKNYTLAATFPLFFGIASNFQVQKVAKIIEEKFLKIGGLLTTLELTKQQWDAPNGWAPLQWMAYKGFLNYGLTELAQKIKTNWVNINLKVYQKTGKMTEKYNVSQEDLEAGGGEYPNQDGFGWTNGVLLKMLAEK